MDIERAARHAPWPIARVMTRENEEGDGSMSEERFATFEEFWPYYVGEHDKALTRAFHFVGTTAAMACVGAAILTRKPLLLALAALAGYGPAWTSHFFIENNRPATFTYPVWSLRADLVMWSLMLRGKMQEEVDRVRAAKQVVEAPKPVSNGGDGARAEAPAVGRLDLN